MDYRLMLIVIALSSSFGLSACKPAPSSNDVNAASDASAEIADKAQAPQSDAAQAPQNDAKSGDLPQTEPPTTEPKGVLCKDDSCLCGKILCGRDSRCDDGVCVCGNERYAFSTDLYVCENGRLKCVGTGGFDSCECGTATCSIGTHCNGDNTCACDGKKPTPEALKAPESWRCQGGVWTCAAGSRAGGPGCECGGQPNKCGAGTSCVDGKCMCASAAFDLDAAAYACENDKIVCGLSDGCACGAAKCGQGGTCRDEACYCGDQPWKFSAGTYCSEGKVHRW